MDLEAGSVQKASSRGTFTAYGYNGQSPGPEIRVQEGDTLRVRTTNRMEQGTTIHWHGVPVPNPMDGVPGLTQEPIRPGESFTYEFLAWPAGTYVYHSHEGYQLDQGLYGALIIEERSPAPVDQEFVLVLEDWVTLDGGGPAASRAGRVNRRGTMGGMMGPGMMGRGHRGRGGHMGMGRVRGDGVSAEATPLLEPDYDAYTINGKLEAPGEVLQVRQGDRARLRLINASSSSIYYVRIAGHELTVTHADGRPVEPVVVDAIRIGMGERYDATIEAREPGNWPILLWADTATEEPRTVGVLRYSGVASDRLSADGGFRGRILAYDELMSLEEEGLPRVGGEVDRVLRMVLSGGMHSPYWTINGEIYPRTDDPRIQIGERVRVEYANRSFMAHPMHLHGHFFELALHGRPLMDTVIVQPHMGSMVLDFVADNPGEWFHHCHNLYHLMAGMANVFRIPETTGK